MLANEILLFKRSFRDICNGYSLAKFEEKSFFIKHVRLEDQILLDEMYEFYFDEARKEKLPTNEESLTRLAQEGLWSHKDEREIKSQESFLKKIQSQKNVSYLKSQIEIFNGQIEETKIKLRELFSKKYQYLRDTCETYADQRLTEEFLLRTFYKDKDLKEKAFSQEEFDSLSISDIEKLTALYNSTLQAYNENYLQRLILQDFFNFYLPFCEDPRQFFGKPVIDLTHNQLRLIIYSRFFKNVLSNHDNIPESIKKDPDKIIDYVNANDNSKKRAQNQEKDNQASSIVGATKEDYEYINMGSKNQKTLSLGEEAKKKGGSLDMKDMIRLMGA